MTDKNEKLFNAIGKLSDSYIEEAYAENPEPKHSRPKKSVKRIVMLAAAALLSVSLVITVAANSDAIIAAMFERRQKLVDDKIGHIVESVTEGDIMLTLNSVTSENAFEDDSVFWGCCTVSFHNENGVFDKGLKYGGYKMQFIFDDSGNGTFGSVPPEVGEDGREWYSWDEGRPDDYDAFLPSLENINFGLDKPSDTITLQSLSSYWMYGINRIIFYDITSADGSIKYADKLCIEFTVTIDNAKPLQQLNYYEPDLPFKIENVGFVLERIDLSTNRLFMKMTNPGGDTVNIGGVDYCAINYLTKFANDEEFFENVDSYFELEEEIRLQLESEYDEREAQEKFAEQVLENEELHKLNDEVIAVNKPTEDEKLLSECYELVVELNPECGAEVTSMQTSCYGWAVPATPDTIQAGFVAEFSAPIYVNDIVRVYAQKIGDPTKQVTVWVPAEDEGLAELNK